MKPSRLITPIILSLAVVATSSQPAKAELSCRKREGNLCYRIDGSQRSRIDRSPAFQKALRAVAKKMEGRSVVYIVQGYRTPQEQQNLVRQHCPPGASSCYGYASWRTSRHVISTAADPMLYGNQVKPICYAENQARVEFLGPRSAAAVYGYDRKTNMTWAHIDDSTGSNYTPRNCGRNEGLSGNSANWGVAQAVVDAADSGAPTSSAVAAYRQRRAQRDPAGSVRPSRYAKKCNFLYEVTEDCNFIRWLQEKVN